MDRRPRRSPSAAALLIGVALLASCGSAPPSQSAPPPGGAPSTSVASAPTPGTPSSAPAASATAAAAVDGLPIGVGNTAATSSTNITLTPDTVLIPLADVRSSLVSVSDDGSVYAFANDSGPLAQLAPGKVMLLQGFDVAVVRSVSHSGSQLVVNTSPTKLSDVVQSGDISVKAPPDFADAFASVLGGDAGVAGSASPSDSPSASASPSSSAGADVVTAAPEVVLAAASPTPPPTNTLSYKGTSGGFTYKIGFTGKADGTHINGEFCYQLVASSSGSSSCGNGLSMQAKLDGVFAWNDQNASFSTRGGAVAGNTLSLDGLTGTMTLNYLVLRGQNSDINADPPVLKIPFAFEFPVCPDPIGCAGIPLYSKVELAVLVKLGVSGRNSTMEGGVNLTINGSASGSQTASGAPAGSSSFGSISGSFTPGTSITPGASAAELALQIKWGLGLGIKGLNLLNYIAFVPAVGQVTGSAVAGQLCQNYYGNFTISYNAEAQLAGFSYATPAKTLYKKSASFKQPGC